jgi:hypothetical protein
VIASCRDVADLGDRPEVAVHRIHRFERDQLGRGGIALREQRLEMRHVVVPEDPLGAARVANARDHRRMVVRIRIDHAAGQQATDRGQRRLVGDEARGEQQRRRLVVQRRQLALQEHVQVGRARDVARAAGAGAQRTHRLDAGVQDHRVLAHAQVVVGAPHGDRVRLGVGIHVALRMRERARLARQIAEHTVAAFAPDPIDRMPKNMLVMHQHLPASDAAPLNARVACPRPLATPHATDRRSRQEIPAPGASHRAELVGQSACVDCLRHHPGALAEAQARAAIRRTAPPPRSATQATRGRARIM